MTTSSWAPLPHPQPIGAFAVPAGLMLVPAGTDRAAVAMLVAGRLPTTWPGALEAHRRVFAGDVAGALGELTRDDPVERYNRWLIDPEGDDAGEVALGLPEAYRPLVDVVRYASGAADTLPVAGDDTNPVVAALVTATRATALLEAGDAEGAAQLVEQAAISVADVPVLHAVLMANSGAILHEHDLDTDRARTRLAGAAAALADTDLTVHRAEIHYALGQIEHERAARQGAPLQGAMHHYYTAVQLFDETTAPELWASAQMSLATAHLSSPMALASDGLRAGVAVQALRAALQVFTRDRYPAQWAAASLNLANALVYAPSVKQGDNLVEAVELYEEVLEVRDRDTDPIGRARTLTNLGNALAHLGIFDHAKARLVEARYLFDEQLDSDGVMTVRGLLDEIVKHTMPEEGRDGSGRAVMGGVDGGTREVLAGRPDADEG